MSDRTITIVNEKNEEMVCEILFTYFSEEFNRHYVVFTTPERNSVGAAIYIEEAAGRGRLENIENDEEWAMLEEVLEDWEETSFDPEACSGCDDKCDGNCNCKGCE